MNERKGVYVGERNTKREKEKEREGHTHTHTQTHKDR